MRGIFAAIYMMIGLGFAFVGPPPYTDRDQSVETAARLMAIVIWPVIVGATVAHLNHHLIQLSDSEGEARNE